MKQIKNSISIALIFLCFMSCFDGGKKLKKSYTNADELKQDIVNAVSEQYGMQFEIGKGLDGSDATIGVGKDFGFYGYLRPADVPEIYKKYNLYTYYTVVNSVGTFKTQAHVRMFEKQLKADVDKILDEIGMKYDIIEFRGMSRDINKWSKNSSYEQYKASKDYETWIYIKLADSIESDEYPKLILPKVKNIYSLLEPIFNVTVIFYIDQYSHNILYGSRGIAKHIFEVIKNPDVVWLDLSKYNNYLEWTEKDIEEEIRIVNEDYYITAWKKANGLD